MVERATLKSRPGIPCAAGFLISDLEKREGVWMEN